MHAYEIEERAEANYRAAVAAHRAAWNNGVEIGHAEIDAAKALLLAIRDRVFNDAAWAVAADWDAAERGRLMLDDA
jgi:hypothetical protein